MEKWIVTSRQRCDLELLLTGAFNPLTGFVTENDYYNILSKGRLSTGQVWPIPINLDVDTKFADRIAINDVIALCDEDNTVLAQMTIASKWQPNKKYEAEAIFATTDKKHPGVHYLFERAGDWYLGGDLELIQLPTHFDYPELRFTPKSLKQRFQDLNWQKIIAFQTRNPLHRAHMELTLRAAQGVQGKLLLHPVVGLTKPGDVDYFTRVRCYQQLLSYYPQNTVELSLLPLAMRMGGPKEALWHALIRKNYGCTHIIIGRDHAGPGKDANGASFYAPFAAQQLLAEYQSEIGIKMIPFQEMVYSKKRQRYCASTELGEQETALNISGTELRNALMNDLPIPEWFSFPEIINELRNSYLPKHKKGFTLFFTGLSSSGKTTLAQSLRAKLMSLGKRNITLLDGDVIRRELSSELGFSKADRDINIKRIGFVASEITKIGGIALCAAIAPYAQAREENRRLIEQFGGYIEIYLSTSVEICATRDRKKVYAKARSGLLKGVTGVDDPYEPPHDAEITIDTSQSTIEDSAQQIIDYLFKEGYLRVEKTDLKPIKYERAV